jgi:uncharacterized protein YbaR (Trm112 family)
MHIELNDILCCPACGGDLSVEITEEDAEIRDGLLKCECGGVYRIRDYVPMFLDEHD